MEDYGYIKHAIMLLSGIDEETGLPKVHPDNFLTNEQIKAVQDLVTFVNVYVDFAESSESDLGLVHKPIDVGRLLSAVHIAIPTDSWLRKCNVHSRIDDKVYPAHTATLVDKGMIGGIQLVIDG